MQSTYFTHVRAALRHTELTADGRPVVFLTAMGLGATHAFLPVLSPVVRQRRLLFVDPFGCGCSDAPFDFGYTLTEQAAVVAAVLEDTGAAGGDVVGFSAGASIAVVLADEHPGLVERLVVAEANLDQGAGSISPWIASQSEREFTDGGHQALLERFDPTGRSGAGAAALHAFFARTASHALYRMARALVDPLERDVRRRLSEVQCPRTYIHGTAAGSELQAGDEGRLRSVGVEVLAVPGAGHLLAWENPLGFARTLATSLA